jgi:hypothetical protein
MVTGRVIAETRAELVEIRRQWIHVHSGERTHEVAEQPS